MAYCSGRNLTDLPTTEAHRTRQLRALILSDNRVLMDDESLERLHWLAFLDLSINGLDDVKQDLFGDLKNLIELVLSHNRMQELTDRAFRGLQSLQKLDLDNNDLVFLSYQTLSHLPKLHHLILTNNPNLDLIKGTFDGSLSLRILNSDAYKFCCVARSVETCTPEADEFSSCEDLMSNFALQVSIWVLGILAFVGNIFVVIWRIRTDRKKVSSFLIINLGVSDWLMGVYMLIIASVDVHYRGTYIIYADSWRASSLCQLAGVLAMLSSEVSVFMLTVITLDRVITIMFPLKTELFRLKKAAVVAGCGWVVCLVLTLLPISKTAYFGDAFFGRTGSSERLKRNILAKILV